MRFGARRRPATERDDENRGCILRSKLKEPDAKMTKQRREELAKEFKQAVEAAADELRAKGYEPDNMDRAAINRANEHLMMRKTARDAGGRESAER